MKTRGFLTLGVAALAGLALAALAAHSSGPGEPPGASELGAGTAVASLGGATTRGAASTNRLAQAAATGHSDIPTSKTSPVPAAPAMTATDVLEPDETAVAATTSALPSPISASSLGGSRMTDAPAAGGDADSPSITIKQDAVIGVRLDRALTTETARVDDRVTAHVARDVLVDDRPALAAGTWVEGHVALVERGPHAVDRVRIGIKFTTIALPDGRRVPLQAETILRESAPDDDAAIAGGRPGLNAFLAGAITRPGPARAQLVPASPSGRDVRIPAGSLLTMKLTGPVTIER